MRYGADLDIPVKILQDNNEGRIGLHHKPIEVVDSMTPVNWPLCDRDPAHYSGG